MKTFCRYLGLQITPHFAWPLLSVSATSWTDEQCSLLMRGSSHTSHPELYPPRGHPFQHGSCYAPLLCTGSLSSGVLKMSPWCVFEGCDSQSHLSFVAEGQLSARPVLATVELHVQTRDSMLPPGQ